MRKLRQQEHNHVEKLPNPNKLGAKKCPKCLNDEHMNISSKTLGTQAVFVEITCNRCFRTAISEVAPNLGSAIRAAVLRWNSNWPDVAYYLDGPSEGTKWIC